MVATTQLEMELWLGDAAGGADARNRLAAGDLVAAFDQDQIAMRIGRDPAIGVFDENEVAITAQLVAGIGDDSSIGRLDCSAARSGNIDAVVVRPVLSRAISG